MGTAKRKRELQLHALRTAFPNEEARAATIEDARQLHVLLHEILDAEIKNVGVFAQLLAAAKDGCGFQFHIEVIPRNELTYNDQPTIPEPQPLIETP